MKNFTLLFLSGISFFFYNTAAAQCSGIQSTITYDTTVYTTGDGTHNYSFPQFNPALGTLTKVTVAATVNMRYSFQLHNGNSSSVTAKVWPTRYDDITSAALSPDLYKDTSVHYGPYPLTPDDGTTNSGTDDTAVGPVQMLNNYNIERDITSNIAPFLGSNNVNFSHDIFNTITLVGGNNIQYSGQSSDTIQFTLTYTYCEASFLAAGITSFSAVKKGDNAVDLAWLVQNEETGRQYEIMMSSDGKKYTPVSTVTAQPDGHGQGIYQYHYTTATNPYPKLLFRLRQTDRNGIVSYSTVRSVEWTKAVTLKPSAYPNPANDYVHIDFGQNKKQDWQVALISATGQLLQQHYYKYTTFANIQFNNSLQNGVYFIKATCLDTQQIFTLPFAVHH